MTELEQKADKATGTMLSPSQRRVFCRADMAAWELLQRPLWVFDCRNTCMWWANEAGLVLWNAVSRDEFLARDYATDMSESVKLRCESIMRRLEQGEFFSEQVCYNCKVMGVLVCSYM
jgi:hypothetical protein